MDLSVKKKRRPVFCCLLSLFLVVSSVIGGSVSLASTVSAQNDPPELSIYPTPQNIEVNGSGFPLSPVVGIVVAEPNDQTVVDELKETLVSAGVKEIKTFQPFEKPTTPVTVYIADNPEAAFITKQLGTLDTELDNPLPKEGYVLAAGQGNDGKKKIILAGADWDGTFYGVKTLKQFVKSHPGRNRIPEVVIEDYPEMPIRGVIEGFYGEPWSQADRIDQINFYAENKMNTYVYAPKDDPYHRDQWRDPYPPDKLAEIGKLVDEARENHIDFVFTISPGLDMCYSDEGEFELLMDKAQAMWDLGVRDFAILLDDIFQDMNCEEDREKFGSAPSPSASAQAYLLNKFQKEFIETHEGANRLITVPTEYYQDGTSTYREQFADLVDSEVLVYWTGIGITTETITNEDAEKISNIFKHDLLIWDNFPVNDFARDRLFLGPLSGRDAELTEHGVRGLTANPMEYAQASKIPLFTVADYTWNPEAYDPKKSWQASIKDFGGSFAEELTTFAENALSSPLREEESPTLSPLINSFWSGYENGEGQLEADQLLMELKKLEAAADVLEKEFDNTDFSEEMNPWIDKMKHYGVAGQLAVEMLLAQQSGDKEVTEGYRLQLEEVLNNDTTDRTFEEQQQASRTLDGVNAPRGWGELVMYTSEFGERTGTNQWGYEITVVDGKVTDSGGNNSVIPDNGYVLSVHSGGDGDWPANNSIVGANVSIEDGVVTITIDEGVYDVPNKKTYAYQVMEPFINQALKTNDLWLGGREEAGPFSTIDAYSTFALGNMTDGNLNTLYWTKGSPKKGDYIGVDLGELQTIRSIELYMASASGPVPRPNDYIKHGVVEISKDGSNWEVIGEYQDQDEISIVLDEEEQARFVRFKVLSDQTGWAQVREFIVE
ncbi:beta-N-acetylglucosaminidase domain-containing protein [Pseudalkalibacillus decolorationis]|uniref:beta-N-acetylglucosaminidase domain-containing protein n=1 Tax=Pseudalkalibacillus decolorationis TaxID=163879 RepID=UPI002147FA48|nr:beta-N-acetylglucosaminidase domain-containing protein [Pseudalkalibacillus decolorationis]